MKKILKFVSLILFLCAGHQALAIQTQINKVTDLFDKHIEDKDALLQNMKQQNDNAMEQIKSRTHHDSIEGIDGAEGKANELNSIKETDLDDAGRQKRGSQEYQFYNENELEPDYTKPGNRMHKLDSDVIVTATEKTMRQIGTDLMKRLIELGFNCKTVKGAIHKDPTYYIDIKKEDQKNTEYDQLFCEEPRNQYSCNDSVSLSCKRIGIRYTNPEPRTIRFNGHTLHNNKMNWGFAVHWKTKRWGWHITPYHPGKTIFGWPDQVDSCWRDNPAAIIADARAYIAATLGVSIEQIGENVTFPASGRGIGNITPVHCRWRVVWDEYEFGYTYREIYHVCEEWAEDWTERCMLK